MECDPQEHVQMITTTLNAIRAHSPCGSGWKKLLTYLGKMEPDDEPLPLVTILDSNGLDDALWCLHAVTGHDREIRLYAVACARDVQHLMTDPRSMQALEIAEKFALGEASEEELADAWEAAWEAAREAAWEAARVAAWADAWASENEAASEEIRKKREIRFRKMFGGDHV